MVGPLHQRWYHLGNPTYRTVWKSSCPRRRSEGNCFMLCSAMNRTRWSRTIGNCTSVGATLAPYSFMSLTQLLWSLRLLAEIPITFTSRLAKSGARRATSPSSVVQTGVKSPGWENRTAYNDLPHKIQTRQITTPCLGIPKNYQSIHEIW